LEEEEIKLIGVETWLDKYLDVCDYVLIIWSIGARIKCSSKINTANFNDFVGLENNTNTINFSKLVNDSFFNHAINYILKKSKHQQESVENNNHKFVNIYFEYSNKNDISYKFDSFKQYKLMVDVKSFLQHIFLAQNFSVISNYLNIIIDENNNVKLKENDRTRNCKKKKYSYNNNNNNQQNDSLLDGKSEELNCQNLNDLKLIYLDQLYKQINNTNKNFKLNPNWFENSLFMNNKNNSALSLDSCLLNFENNNNNNNKLISLSINSSLESIPILYNNAITSSASSTSFKSNFKNAYSNTYFVHPLPSSIDLNYFNLIEEKVNNTSNNNYKRILGNVNLIA
jgi:hypothetical protein